MGIYMYPIIIRREQQMVSNNKEFELGYDSTLTLLQLRDFGVTDDKSFQIIEEENTQKYILYVYGKRLETQEEVNERVIKEESYMENYTKFQANNPKRVRSR